MTAHDSVRRAAVGDVELAYETFGDATDPALLLIMGIGSQTLDWPEEVCAELAARGHFVVRFDNRDVGLSTHQHEAPLPDLAVLMSGAAGDMPYSLAELAADTAGLIEALGRDSAHIVGVSMGGMIGQLLAIEHPGRVRSLTSMLAHPGDSSKGRPTDVALGALGLPPARTREAAIERQLAVRGSSAHPASSPMRRRSASASVARSTAGTTRPAWPARPPR